MVYNLFFLPVIVYLGLRTSYEDIKCARIRNPVVAFGLLYATLLMVVSVWFRELPTQLAPYAAIWGINVTLAAAFAYGLWMAEVWGAGDAKLFIAYVALIATRSSSYFTEASPFIFFDLFIASFLPAFIYLLVEDLLRLATRQTNRRAHESAGHAQDRTALVEYARTFLGFFCFFSLLRVLRMTISSSIVALFFEPRLFIFICLIANKPIAAFFQKHPKTLLILAGGVYVAVLIVTDYSLAATLRFLLTSARDAAILSAVFMIIVKYLTSYASRGQNRKIPFAYWMFVGILIIWAVSTGKS